MATPEQAVLDVLLDILASRGLIDQSTCDKAKTKVHAAPDFPDFFGKPVCCRREDGENGCAQD